MAQLNGYASLVKKALSEYVRLATKRPNPDYDVITIFDDDSQQYLVLDVGWEDNKRIQRLVLHVAIHDGKIWVEEDWTEDGVAMYFLEHDVPNDHIVLGFQSPMMRPYTEFAVA